MNKMPKTKTPDFSLISSARGMIHAYQIASNQGSVFKKTWCGKNVDGKGKEDRVLHGQTLKPMNEAEMLERITCMTCCKVAKL